MAIITRRQFLKRSSLATAGTLVGPGLFSNLMVRNAMADTIGNKYLIVIFLDGGNDGQNTVIPFQNGALRTAYDLYRNTGGGGINVSQAALAPFAIGNDPGTSAQLALHPGLTGLKDLYDLGKVAVVQGCGYPDYSLSHEEARLIWQTANPSGYSALTGTGWIGRHLAHASAGYTGADVPGVAISGGVPEEFRQTDTSVLAVDRLEDFGFPYDWFNYSENAPLLRQAFRDLHAVAQGETQPARAYIGSTGDATLLSSENYPSAHTVYEAERETWADSYPSNSTGRALREIAKIVWAQERNTPIPGIESHFFWLDNGGYDTHSDQGAGETDGAHYTLHREIGDAVKAFYNDLLDMGAADRFCIVTYSEFARRIPQNDNGTDHGSQGPMFVIGGGVNGGVYGNHPDITNLDGDENTEYRQDAVPQRSTDFRDVFGTIMKHFVGMTGADTLSILPLDVGNPAFNWTVANFDMTRPVGGVPLFQP